MLIILGLISFLLSLFWLLWNARRATWSEELAFKKLGLRLEHYAVLKGREGGVFKDGLLKPEQHDILLGVLKKIEAKNAVYATIILFFITVILRVVGKCSWEVPSLIAISLTIGALLGAVLARLDGAGHLDQTDFNKIYSRAPYDFFEQRRNLQKALMLDLLRKEALFRSTFYVIVVAIILLAVALVFRIHFVSSYFQVSGGVQCFFN